MWTWIPAFLAASFAAAGTDDPAVASFAAFAVVGAGGVGGVAAGAVADRVGRTTLTMTAMALSGSSALVIGFLFGAPPVLTLVLGIIWEVTVVADSAQFSVAVTELGTRDRRVRPRPADRRGLHAHRRDDPARRAPRTGGWVGLAGRVRVAGRGARGRYRGDGSSPRPARGQADGRWPTLIPTRRDRHPIRWRRTTTHATTTAPAARGSPRPRARKVPPTPADTSRGIARQHAIATSGTTNVTSESRFMRARPGPAHPLRCRGRGTRSICPHCRG